MRLWTGEVEMEKRGQLRERSWGTESMSLRYEGWKNRNICTIFASSEFWLGELIEVGNAGMTPNFKLTSGSIIAFLYYAISEDIFVSLGSSFSWIAPTCVHTLFKIIPIRYSVVFTSQEPNFHVFTFT